MTNGTVGTVPGAGALLHQVNVIKKALSRLRRIIREAHSLPWRSNRAPRTSSP